MAQVAHRLFTVDEYHRMGVAGILTERDRVELIEGEVVEMSPVGSVRAACVDRMNSLLVRRIGRRAIVRVQSPIVLNEFSEPEPDVAVLRPRADFYAVQHPDPADVLLVIEVADSSREFDRAIKIPLYARSGIPEVWLVDLIDEVVEVYRKPLRGTYRHVERFPRGRRVNVAALRGVSFRVDDMLGGRAKRASIPARATRRAGGSQRR